MRHSKKFSPRGSSSNSKYSENKRKAPTAQQGQQPQDIRILSYLIQYGNAIYHFLGVSLKADFNQFTSYFTNTMEGFRELTDQKKLNKKPERIHIKTINSNSTFEQTLRNLSVTDKRFEELAILTGMKLSDKVTAGMKIKILGL